MLILENNLKKKKSIQISFVDKKVKLSNLKKFEGKFNTFMFDGKTVFVGIKSENKIKKDDWRELGFNLNKYLHSLKIKKVSLILKQNSSEFIQGLLLANYSFDKYKSEVKINKIKCYINLTDIINEYKDACIKVKAQFLTRDWVNTTPEDANSSTITMALLQRFQNSKITIDVYDEKQLEKLNMNGHLAVNRASRHEAKTVKLTYTPNKKAKKTIVVVGKGLTYDSGGLSIKTGSHMTTMKADKAGAMTLFGTMDIIEKLGSENKIVFYLAFAENMIDGSAYKPDDVITMKNGKTVHVKNTDAEGRIVLFDNLCLAQEENPELDEIYSIATLTGAAVYQFGDEAAGVVGFNDKMKKSIMKIGKKEGEIFMDAAFHKHMMKGVDDSLADISNTGTPNQGCQKAGLFLTKALEPKNIKKYLHIDIAGPAFVDTAFGTNPSGGTGFGVRSLYNLFK